MQLNELWHQAWHYKVNCNTMNEKIYSYHNKINQENAKNKTNKKPKKKTKTKTTTKYDMICNEWHECSAVVDNTRMSS